MLWQATDKSVEGLGWVVVMGKECKEEKVQPETNQ